MAKIMIELPDEAIQYAKELPNTHCKFNVSWDDIIKAIKNSTEDIIELQPLLAEYEEIIQSTKDVETITKKIDEWCIDTMRGIIGNYYAEKIQESNYD